MNEIEILVILLSLLPFVFAGAGGAYFAVKKFLTNLAVTLEDDVITKAELEQLIKDSFNIINVFKHLFKR